MINCFARNKSKQTYEPLTVISGVELGGINEQSSPFSGLLSGLLWKLSEQLLEPVDSLSLWFGSWELVTLVSEQFTEPFSEGFSSTELFFKSAVFLQGNTAWLRVEHKAANTPSFDLECLPIRCFFIISSGSSLGPNFRFSLKDSTVASSPSEISDCFLSGGL